MGSVFDGHSRLPSKGTEMNWTAINGVVAICHVVFFISVFGMLNIFIFGASLF